jgi:hypothetical protein
MPERYASNDRASTWLGESFATDFAEEFAYQSAIASGARSRDDPRELLSGPCVVVAVEVVADRAAGAVQRRGVRERLRKG